MAESKMLTLPVDSQGDDKIVGVQQRTSLAVAEHLTMIHLISFARQLRPTISQAQSCRQSQHIPRLPRSACLSPRCQWCQHPAGEDVQQSLTTWQHTCSLMVSALTTGKRRCTAHDCYHVNTSVHLRIAACHHAGMSLLACRHCPAPCRQKDAGRHALFGTMQ